MTLNLSLVSARAGADGGYQDSVRDGGLVEHVRASDCEIRVILPQGRGDADDAHHACDCENGR